MAELDIDPILQTRKPTDLPEPITQAVRGGLQILGEEAEHVLVGLPKEIMEQSELLRTTGEYNPAPMVELLSLGAGGGMGAAEKDAIGVFGGRAWARDVNFLADPKARTFVPPGSSLARERKYRPAYDAALLMEQAGMSREEIFDETGWFRGHDGKWRFEISDKGAQLIPVEETPKGRLWLEKFGRYPDRAGSDKLSDVLKHPKLFEQYPDLAELEVHWDAPPQSASYSPYLKIPSPGGTAGGAKDYISLDPNDTKLLSRLLHEIQHAVQAREGFSPGGNPSEWRLIDEAMKAHEKFPGSASARDLAYEAYMRHAGEVEARNVQYRAAGLDTLTKNIEDVNRAKRSVGSPELPLPRPWQTEDRPASQLIFRKLHDRPPRIRLTPVKGDPFARDPRL